jgi:exopolysaccharide production protein ExoZ
MYRSLQLGRAVAAILVVLFHLGGAIAAKTYFGFKEFSIPFSFGTAGVPFFFVLSGFIIFNAHRGDVFQFNKLDIYLRKRFVRIYPTYWIIFLTVYFLALSRPELRNTVPHDSFLVLKSLLLIPQDKSEVGGTGAPVLIVAWTLQYEIFFYLFFSLFILSRWLSALGVAILLFIYLKYASASLLPFPLMFLSQDYVLLFPLGMGVSMVCGSGRFNARRPFFYAGIGAWIFLLVALDTVTGANLFTEWKTILYGLGSALIIFGLVQAEDKGRFIRKHNWMQLLGDSSYALYLMHYPLISFLCKVCMSFKLNKYGFIGAFVSYISIFIACLISAIVFHVWIEKPVTGYVGTSLKSRSDRNAVK